MNVNEVLCSYARDAGISLLPNDHVNMGQSSNDVIPSALYIASATLVQNELVPALAHLENIIKVKAKHHSEVIKTGRTHLMDALPVKLQDEMEGWAGQINDCQLRFKDVLKRLGNLPLGGTAVGSGVNCAPGFTKQALGEIKRITGLNFSQSSSFFTGLSSIDTALEASSHLKTTACALMKIANDLRWMNSGPHSSIGEITLPPMQPGSSIMPDKVNPVIPEAVCMAAAQVIGNDTTITIAAQSGNFQLNTMLPLVAARLIESIDLITNSSYSLGEKAIKDMRIMEEKMNAPLKHNPILVTALVPLIGYNKAAEIAKKARQESRTLLDVAKEETDIETDTLKELLNPQNLAKGKMSP